MLTINNGFLSHHSKYHNVKFHGSDNEALFENNLKIQPTDWYYRTHEITYERNSNGHRCKEITDIDLDNYILFTGCSHTEGTGLELEKTYPYLLSQKIKCDYYNLAVGGSGIDVLNYNIVTWFSKVKKLPKLLVIQWPNLLRMTLETYSKEHSDYVEYTTHGLWSLGDKRISEFLVLGDKINFFKTTRTLTKNIIHNIANCPIVEIGHPANGFTDVDLMLIQKDSARDVRTHGLGHMGIESQKIHIEKLYEKAIKLINT